MSRIPLEIGASLTKVLVFLAFGAFSAAGIAGCEDDPILTPDDSGGGGAPGSYGSIKIAIEVSDSRVVDPEPYGAGDPQRGER